MEKNKKNDLFKYMFIVSTVCGALGVFFLYKEYTTAGWIFIGIWGVLAVLVRVLIMKNK